MSYGEAAKAAARRPGFWSAIGPQRIGAGKIRRAAYWGVVRYRSFRACGASRSWPFTARLSHMNRPYAEVALRWVFLYERVCNPPSFGMHDG